jgi:hypothetical protein
MRTLMQTHPLKMLAALLCAAIPLAIAACDSSPTSKTAADAVVVTDVANVVVEDLPALRFTLRNAGDREILGLAISANLRKAGVIVGTATGPFAGSFKPGETLAVDARIHDVAYDCYTYTISVHFQNTNQVQRVLDSDGTCAK